MITRNYTKETTFSLRSFDAKTRLFFDTRANAEAFANHPANFGREFAITEWKLPEGAI